MIGSEASLSAALSAAATKAAPVVASLAGSFVGLSTFKHLNTRGRWISAFNGFAVAYYVSPVMIEQQFPHASQAMINLLHFGVGLFGLTLLPTVATILRDRLNVNFGVLREPKESQP